MLRVWPGSCGPRVARHTTSSEVCIKVEEVVEVVEAVEQVVKIVKEVVEELVE